MQRFTFLLLVASVALLATFVPVEATRLAKRETNGQRFARDLPPLRPKRSHVRTAKRSQVSHLPGQLANTGILQVANENGDILGWVFNDQAGPIALNLVTNPTPADKNLTVTYINGNLLAQVPEFPRPYIGGNGTDILSPQNLNTVPFTDVSDGPFANIWTLDQTTGLLSATWTNSDGTIVTPTLVFNPVSGVLSFTANPTGVYNEQGLTAVTISLIQ